MVPHQCFSIDKITKRNDTVVIDYYQVDETHLILFLKSILIIM